MAGTCDEWPRHGKFVTSKIVNKPSQILQKVKPQARIEWTKTQKLVPDEEYILSDDQKEDGRIPPQEVPDDTEIPSEEAEGVERILPPKWIPDAMRFGLRKMKAMSGFRHKHFFQTRSTSRLMIKREMTEWHHN